jgi:hypothetical protein
MNDHIEALLTRYVYEHLRTNGVKSDAWCELLGNPNPLQHSVIPDLQRQMVLWGIAYLWAIRNKHGAVCELWVIPSRWIWPREEYKHTVDCYEVAPYRTADGKRTANGLIKIPKDEVIAIDFNIFCPSSPWVMDKVEPARLLEEAKVTEELFIKKINDECGVKIEKNDCSSDELLSLQRENTLLKELLSDRWTEWDRHDSASRCSECQVVMTDYAGCVHQAGCKIAIVLGHKMEVDK